MLMLQTKAKFTDKMIHSLDAYKYLKVDKMNYIYYQC
jgi:hypothetical protein